MKDIGLLTFHDTNNFGAILQTYASYEVLKSMGYDVEIIDYQCDSIYKRENPMERHRHIKRVKGTIKWILKGYKEQKKYNELMNFLYTNTIISEKKYLKHTFKECEKEYRAILVGSDMLWCTRYTNSDYSYMLEGIVDCEKISYATSVGYSWSELEEKNIICLLDDFSFISVRELDTMHYLSQKLKKSIQVVCDPTMLIDSITWKKFVKRNILNKYCFVYMDDSNRNCAINGRQYSKDNNLCYKEFKYKIGKYGQSDCYELFSIEDFLTAIFYAKIVFTASYHGLLFALYFHVPFVFYNKDKSRMATLSEKLGIGYRDGNKYRISEMKSIDWNDIDYRLEAFRKESKEILLNMLKVIHD